jgi:ribonucleotide reductase alpha subunit
MAIAPQRVGLGLRRHFTTEGVHPYDEVRWERRDSRIVNYRDGSVAFEQLGVEVPDGWSQNATNILAQKYFRGTLGTPEREWSLKQVADRVVDTLTAWGIKDGYFVDDAEAEIFRDELKHLIVHQKAAFNSPVWFNIGVDGVPQQGSACQPYDALVSTPEGMVPIGRLVEEEAIGTKVLDAHGVTRIVAVKHNGRKEVLRIHTTSGHALDVTADHLVWRCSDERYGRFAPAAELRPGDCLAWHRAESFGDGEISSRSIGEAALAGWLQSDRLVGQYEGTNRSLTVEAMTVTEAERAWVSAAVDTVFPGVHRHERKVATDDTTLDCRHTRLYGAPLRAFVEDWGLLVRGVEMTVPERLMTAPLPVVAAYLRSLFQAEGYVSVNERSAFIGLDMISEGVVRGAQTLLARFGIFSRVRFKADRRVSRKGCWSLAIRSLGDRRAFADEIGFLDRVKAEKLERTFDLPGNASSPSKRLQIERIEQLGETDVYDIQTESGEYLSANLRVHNCFILSVDDSMDSILNWYTEEGIIFKGGSGAGVNLSRIRSSNELLKGGGTASGPVSFMRGADASAGTIKSGGKTRRAAKMVILDVDHPDIEDFIWCKAIEERKARVLAAAGFDMDLDGSDSHSTQYQNANNSVRVTDEFMEAVLDGRDWELTARTDGSVIRRVPARDLFRQIAHAAWECADPGMQFDTTINKWHTAPNTGRINGSNPCCFVGETQIMTDEGLVEISEIRERCDAGLELPTVVARNPETGATEQREVVKAWVAGYTSRLVEVSTERGGRFRCTPDHRFLTEDAGYVEARLLRRGTRLQSVGARDCVVDVTPVVLDADVPVYDIEVASVHNFAVAINGRQAVIVSNSEYMHLDNSACNLASLNLMKFLNDDGSFDVAGFKASVEVVFTGQEIIVGNADYPTEKIAENSRRFRELGLGYANLGALLMANGLPYDSDAGRAWAAAITALMTGHAYATSARTAARMGPFAGYHDNAEPMVNVLRMHQGETAKIDEEMVPPELLSAAQEAWDEAVECAERYGVRNSQASVLAPTGTIGLLMDCDTTGVEPDLGLVKTKKLVGGGTMSIVNQTVPRALRQLGYSSSETDDIVAHIDEHKSIVGAPHFRSEHLPVFACSMGDNTIHYSGHVRMMGAVQPFISGAISKTVNMPEEVTVEEIEQLHIDAWKLGIKAVAIYRDNCKVAQPLSTTKKESGDIAPPGSAAEAKDRAAADRIAELEAALEHERQRRAEPLVVGAVRERLPRRRQSKTFAFRVADCEGYVTVGEYEDGRPGEVFIKVSKQGSTLAGIMDAFSISISLGLQHGVPLATYVRKYTNLKFEPAGITDDPDLRIAASLVDYIFRRLALDYLSYDDRLELGVLSTSERIQPTLPGVEESATESRGVVDDTMAAAPLVPQTAVGDAGSTLARAEARDAPFCYNCGDVMQRAGSCYVCGSCGSTSGCS